LVMRAEMRGRPGYREVLRQVKETALGAYAHQDLPFEKLVEEMKPERDMSHSPLIQVMFALQNVAMGTLELGRVEASRFEYEMNTTHFDLTMGVKESEEGLGVVIEYSKDLFEAETIRRMM